jgi:hypothetical protein
MNDQAGVNAAPVEREAALGPFAAQILIIAVGHNSPHSDVHPMIAGAAENLPRLRLLGASQRRDMVWIPSGTFRMDPSKHCPEWGTGT